MSPSDFVTEMKNSVEMKGVLTPKQILQSNLILDEGYRFITQRLEDNFEDMNNDAVNIARKLQSFLHVFIEHSHNFALLRQMEDVS